LGLEAKGAEEVQEVKECGVAKGRMGREQTEEEQRESRGYEAANMKEYNGYVHCVSITFLIGFEWAVEKFWR